MRAAMANDRWSLDLVSDQLTDRRRFRILTVNDNCTRECLALVADPGGAGNGPRGRPKMTVSDNGSELTSNAVLTWADRTRVD